MNGDADVGANWRRGGAFIVGAIILILELEFHDETRWGVIALALVLMSVVTIDQLRSMGVLHLPGRAKHAPHAEEPTETKEVT